MYATYEEFNADYDTVKEYYEQFSEKISWMKDPDPAKAWDIYQQAKNQELGVLVMGRTCVDEQGRFPKQFGNAITLEEHEALGIITHKKAAAWSKHGGDASGKRIIRKSLGGMVMHFYAKVPEFVESAGYHFLYNDAWLLGGAHRPCTFNLASPRTMDNIWVGGESGRLTATGREVVFLNSCGFKIHRFGPSNLEVYEYEGTGGAAVGFRGLVAAIQAATYATCFPLSVHDNGNVRINANAA